MPPKSFLRHASRVSFNGGHKRLRRRRRVFGGGSGKRERGGEVEQRGNQNENGKYRDKGERWWGRKESKRIWGKIEGVGSRRRRREGSW